MMGSCDVICRAPISYAGPDDRCDPAAFGWEQIIILPFFCAHCKRQLHPARDLEHVDQLGYQHLSLITPFRRKT